MKKLILGAILLVPAAAHAQEQQGRTVALDECIASALEKNPDAKTSELEIDAAKESKAGARGEMLPKVRADGHLQQWNGPFDLAFALGPGPAPSFRVRDPFTWDATVSVIQPITGLIPLYQRLQNEGLGVDIAQLKRDATRRDLAFRVAETYLRLLEAKRLDEVAKASVTQLEAQRKQAQSLLANGVIGKNDELRAELALASAKQREISARGQVVLVRGRLASLMGLPADSAIEPAPVAGDPPPPDEATLAAAEQKAVSDRIELKELEQQIGRADGMVSARRSKLFPEVSAVGSYQHIEGSAFAQKDAAYVGLNATWEIWDWGSNYAGIHEAVARREQAKLALVKLHDDVRLEARKAYVELESAREALTVAKAAVEQAEENYRIVTKRFENAAGTSFDVVDAEALLTTARAQVEDAFYGYLVARMALQRATGSTSPRVR